MNKGKNGRPYEYPDSLIISMAVIRAMTSLAYRKLYGLGTEALGEGNVPHFTDLRKRILALDARALDSVSCSMVGKNKMVIRLIPDGTGLEPFARGEFLRAKHSVRRGFIRFTAITEHDTMKIVGFEITDESTGEAMNLNNTLADALKKMGVNPQNAGQDGKHDDRITPDAGTIQDGKTIPSTGNKSGTGDHMPDISLLGDGLYSSSKYHHMCEKLGITLLSPLPRNAAAKTRGRKGGYRRKMAVLEQQAMPTSKSFSAMQAATGARWPYLNSSAAVPVQGRLRP